MGRGCCFILSSTGEEFGVYSQVSPEKDTDSGIILR